MKKTGRRDLRSEEFVCTIDPETARDLDDALSIRKTKKGTYKVGVHIADVSHFVKPGTALDEEAQQRSTSVYFVDKVVPMLPRRLCEDYCSLNPSEDKLAFSSLFELSEDGTVLEEWFGQSIIRSRCRLSYEQAQEIIDTGATPIDVTRECELSGEGEATLKEKVFKSVQLLYQVASVLRKKSLAKGRLTVPNTRLGFQFEEQDSKLAPKAFFVKSQIHANWLVEEFMLLANCRTAEKVVQYLPEGTMLRRHAPPEKKKLTVLKQSLKECGIILIGGDAKGLQDTLDSAKGHPCYEALSQLLKYSLCRAEYFANDLLETTFRSHFALGFPWYCHFTSPIRRYTDVVSHRQLLLALEVEKRMKESGMELPTVADVDVVRKPGTEAFDVTAVLPVSQLETRDYYYPLYTVEEFAERANEKKENARLAGDESLRMYFCLYVKALEKMRTKNPNIPKELLTTVAVLQLKPASVLLYSAEIATEVQMGLEDTKQRFMPISAVVVPEEGKTEVDGMAAAAAKAKNFVHTTDANTGDSTTPHILLDWGINPYTKLNVTEKMYAFSEAVASLHVSMHTGKMSLQMVLLPPWEREAYLAGGQKIPTSLVEFDN
ncbi:ribonuclease II-like protein [Angomonas deanei]|uniref:RNB domain containing protein, putative n=1 Tax=Angomonas deanei TaxID=59799 RepID=A0A7G2CJ00_9TRYP|nr:ribonuclease II-like protein [Angomonas deanei]CAD2219027.1 RNB domain containing protein, putative [Angomonas deanei]|eukprot:EPY25420.1 ribonuclease II-like protein [Angomonas deanei]